MIKDAVREESMARSQSKNSKHSHSINTSRKSVKSRPKPSHIKESAHESNADGGIRQELKKLKIGGCSFKDFKYYGPREFHGDKGAITTVRRLEEIETIVITNILNSYKGRDGTFKEPLENDIEGLLELFEATYLGVPGEIMIDDALAFTRGRLEHILKDPSLKNTTVSKQIEEALKRPLHKRLPRLEALRYIPFYQQQASHNESLLKLAMLGFNLLQSLHKIELSQISMWWKRYDVPNNLPYARNRLVECYFWSLSVFFEPQYSQSRMFLAKFISVETLLDDTYDAYGTYEELEMIEYIESYLKEAKWAKDGYIPSMEEHQEVTLVSSGYKNTLIASFCAMGVVITDDTFKWALTMPPIAKACCVLCRVMDDIVTHKLHHDCIFSATKLTFKMG
ncbi:alpha-isocomene synthase-like [Bidens hawaiensis]|uniref:alpha-isocomene synthase-like n=1 Tax=Bidens hawaiensis TaxID=980011 RepID=UPI00404917E0